ncbi:MAG: hypothetical protein ACUVR0_04160 [Candidatus Aminicenantales bacterium]
MISSAWLEEISAAIVVCGVNGVIIYMNNQAAADFKDYGGRELIRQNVLACHPPAAKKKLLKLLTEEQANIYTVEKKEVKKSSIKLLGIRTSITVV